MNSGNKATAIWLASLGLEKYSEIFEENEVDLETLLVLTEQDLNELGLPFGPRKKLLAAISKLQLASHVDSPDPDQKGERRQLTVLFCDMVGFTEMAEKLDPEVLQGIIRDYENTCAGCISRLDGYLFQRVGDGIVAFFGYPLAHENEADRAIRAGFDILDSLAQTEFPDVGRIRARIGVATGVVVVSNSDRSAAGEAMNLAARLQAIAEPGTISISERVHQLAGGAFSYVDLGAKQLKGISKPARIYQVVGLSDAATRFEADHLDQLVPILGRKSELRLLAEKWKKAQSGEGQVVVLAGEAGIGKSRILNALRESLDSYQARAISFQCSPYHLNRALYPSVTNFERTLHLSKDEAPDSKLDKLEALLVNRYGRSLNDVQLIATMMSIPCEHRYGRLTLNPRRFKEETIQLLVDLTEAAGRQRSSVVFFEDIHWADQTSIDALDLLVERIASIPLLLVITARPEFPTRWESIANVSWLNLGKLDREQSEALVTLVAGGKSLPVGLTERILEKTDGVPLFVEELTKTLIESDALIEGEHGYNYLAGAAGLAIPATLRDSLMARLDRDPQVREIAQIGAAIGREFNYELLAAATGLPREDLYGSLNRLTISGLAFRRGNLPDATFTFKHALVQDTAYESMLKTRRQELHAKIAHAMVERFPDIVAVEPELPAQHFSVAGLNERALPYWKRAGDLALQRFALPDAIAHLRKALIATERIPVSPERDLAELGVRTRLGTAIVAARSWAAPDVNGVLAPAHKLARSLEHHASYLPILHGLWVHSLVTGRLTESLEWAEELLSTPSTEDDLTLSGHRAAMTSSFWLGDLVAARSHGDKIRALYDPARHQHIVKLTNSDPLTGDGIYRCQYLWMLGYPEQAVAVTLENHAHARSRENPFDLAFALTLGAQVFDFINESDRLLEHAREGEEVGREHDLPVMSEVLAEISKGIAWHRCDHAESVKQLQEATRRLAETGQLIWGPYLKAQLAEAISKSGNTELGLELVEEALNECIERHEWSHRAEILRLRGCMLLSLGRKEEALEEIEAAIAFSQEQQSRSWELRSTITLAKILANQGSKDEALKRLQAIYGWFTEGLNTHDLKQAKQFINELKSM